LENQLYSLLEQLEDAIEKGGKVPFTAKVMVDEEQVLEILESIKSIIPQEIQQANILLMERDRLMEDAREESRRLLSSAEKQAEQMVAENDITIQAQEYAEDLIKKAQAYSNDVKLGALKYADELLRNLESKIDSTFKALRASREELAIMSRNDEDPAV